MNTQYYNHLCACSCGSKIEIKKWHRKNTMYIFINGHNRRKKSKKCKRSEH